MCDYCDCRQLTPIAELSADHERLLALSARIRTAWRACDRPTAAALLDELLGVLRPHARREEVGLFVALAVEEEFEAVVPALLADHEHLDGPVELTEPGVNAFLAELAAHIDREEHDVFPAAIQLLAPSAWSDVMAATVPAASA